jgi:3,4-dihydroxy-9,10-secoandrosta-1,3,5(10)-triene-9,17-dione 4,5-dioxygenase
MTVAEGPGEGQLLLRMDERAWRIAIEPGEGGLAYSGWEVPDEASLRHLVGRLEANGVPTKEAPDLAAKRGVAGLVTCEDPAGLKIELFHGAFVPQQNFASPTGARFVTSLPDQGELGFGHTVLMHPRELPMKEFYLDILGFRVSDSITVGPVTGTFTHVNPRHHSLALVGLPQSTFALNHIMVEVVDIDTVGRALDVVLNGGGELALTLGKHTNDHMMSFYVTTPSGCMIEYGCEGRLVDDATWTTASYDAPSYWGHKNALEPSLESPPKTESKTEKE